MPERRRREPSAEGTRRGRVREGGFPPLVRGVRGASPGKFSKSALPEVASDAFLDISQVYLVIDFYV